MGILFATAAIGYVESWELLRARERTIFDESWALGSMPFYTEGATIWLYDGMLVSFYFMYNVRRRGET